MHARLRRISAFQFGEFAQRHYLFLSFSVHFRNITIRGNNIATPLFLKVGHRVHGEPNTTADGPYPPGGLTAPSVPVDPVPYTFFHIYRLIFYHFLHFVSNPNTTGSLSSISFDGVTATEWGNCSHPKKGHGLWYTATIEVHAALMLSTVKLHYCSQCLMHMYA
jgi:hypothetical protein